MRKLLNKFNINDVKACLRTAGSLMLGNSLVVPILTNGTATYWWILVLGGIILMTVTSLKD